MVGQRKVDERLDMGGGLLGKQCKSGKQGGGGRAINPGRADRAHARAGHGLGGRVAAVLALFPRRPPGEPAAGRELRSNKRIEPPQPFVAVEASNIGVGNGRGMIGEPLA